MIISILYFFLNKFLYVDFMFIICNCEKYVFRSKKIKWSANLNFLFLFYLIYHRTYFSYDWEIHIKIIFFDF